MRQCGPRQTVEEAVLIGPGRGDDGTPVDFRDLFGNRRAQAVGVQHVAGFGQSRIAYQPNKGSRRSGREKDRCFDGAGLERGCGRNGQPVDDPGFVKDDTAYRETGGSQGTAEITRNPGSGDVQQFTARGIARCDHGRCQRIHISRGAGHVGKSEFLCGSSRCVTDGQEQDPPVVGKPGQGPDAVGTGRQHRLHASQFERPRVRTEYNLQQGCFDNLVPERLQRPSQRLGIGKRACIDNAHGSKFCEEVRTGPRPQFRPGVGSQSPCLRRVAFAPGFVHLTSVGTQHPRCQLQLPVLDAGVGGDGGVTRAVESCEHTALADDTGLGDRVIERRDQIAGAGVADTALDPDGALTGGRQHVLGFENGRRASGQPQPVQSGHCQQCGRDVAAIDLGQARIDVAAKHHDFQVFPPVAKLGTSALRRRADDGTRRQFVNAGCRRADERITCILPRENTGNLDPVGQNRFEILHGMNRDIDVTGEEGLFHLLGEQTLSADVGQWAVGHAVTGRANDDEFDVINCQVLMGGREFGPDLPGLSEGELAAAGADTHRRAPVCALRRHGEGASAWRRKAQAKSGVTHSKPCSYAMIVLGIETSCDETAAAVVNGEREILSNVILSQLDQHRAYGGVVPEIASRAHVQYLDGIIEQAMDEAEVTFGDLAGVAATAGPGLIGGVMVGLVTGKAIAGSIARPLIAMNHLEGHALSVRLTHGIEFPYLLLLVSGGHCQLVEVTGVGAYHRLGTTIDDAIGEAFDKTAKMLGLEYPGGPAVERTARDGDPKRFDLPRPMRGREGCDFSFSGLKTAVRHAVADLGEGRPGPQDAADLAASFQAATGDVLVDRTTNALADFSERHPYNRVLVVAGGVAANGYLRDRMTTVCDDHGFRMLAPPANLCTDNAAMIAWAGLERLRLDLTDPLDAPARARWPLDEVKQLAN